MSIEHLNPESNETISLMAMLAAAMDEVDRGEIPKDGQAMLIVVDRGESGDDFIVHWRASKIQSSEQLALLEVTKTTVLEHMGFLNVPPA